MDFLAGRKRNLWNDCVALHGGFSSGSTPRDLVAFVAGVVTGDFPKSEAKTNPKRKVRGELIKSLESVDRESQRCANFVRNGLQIT